MNKIKVYFMLLFLTLEGSGCFSTMGSRTKNTNNQIIDYKRRHVEDLVNDNSKFDCDTIFSGWNYYSIWFDGKKSAEEIGRDFLKISKNKSDGYSSAVLKERLMKNKIELKKASERVSKMYPNDILVTDTDKIIFENYITNNLESETKIINNRPIIFFNDRLLGLCTAMTSLVLSLTVQNGSNENEKIFPGENYSDLITDEVKTTFKELVMHFLYDCHRGVFFPDKTTRNFREYMEFFVLAHEYAHVNFKHMEYYDTNFKFKLNPQEVKKYKFNKWMDELQADLYATNLIISKYHLDFDNYDHLELLTAGAFYFTCVDLISKSKLLIESNNPEADTNMITQQDRFMEMVRLLEIYPYSLTENVHFEIDNNFSETIDSIINLTHPPAFARTNFIASTLMIQTNKVQESLTPKQLAAFHFGLAMCQVLMNIFLESKNHFIKK